MVKSSSFKITWDQKALDHFKDILTYLEKQSTQAPRIVKIGVINRLELVRKNPLSCEVDLLKEPANKNYRAFVVFSYRITYQIKTEEKEIRVLRIRHCSREPLGY